MGEKSMIIKTFVAGPVDSNCYIVTDEESGEAAVVDCGEFSAEIEAALENVKLKYILLTHGHADHLLGVYDMKNSYPDAQIVISEEDSPCLTDEMYSFAVSIAPGCQRFLSPDTLVKEGDVLTFGNESVRVLHTPGHTPGSVCYLFEKSGVLFTGDTLFCLTVGRTDLPGGNDEQMYYSVKRFFDMQGDFDIYPGHNRATTLEYERRRNRYMRRYK